MKTRMLAIITMTLLFSACGSDETQPGAATTTAPDPVVAARASTLSPTDADLKSLYEQTCRNCHTAPQSGAPLTGDDAAWAPRMAQGMDTLLDHTINGYRGMPPLGSCMDCGESDFEALIRFMASAN